MPQAHRLPRWLSLGGAALLSLACTQGLNWREVHVGELTAMLPCKPDNATRPVVLDAKTYSMEMLGCEAATAMFTISHVQADDPAQAALAMALLRTASMAAVQARNIHPMPNSGDVQTSFDVQVDGLRPDSTAVQARFKWLARGKDIYQLAVYADRITEEQTETLLHEARFK